MSMTEDDARRKATSESLMHYCNEITRLMLYIGRELSECTRIVEQNYRKRHRRTDDTN